MESSGSPFAALPAGETQEAQLPKRVEEQIKPPEGDLKSDVQGFRGGLRIDLKRVMENGKTVEDDLSQYAKDMLDQEIRNQEQFVSKINDWQKIYKGVRDPKTWPWDSCANVSIPIVRSNVDTIYVRQIDNLFNKRLVWLVNAKKDEYYSLAKKIQDALHWYQENVLDLRRKIQAPLMQAIKIGTGIGKLVYEEKRKVVYRYATPAEEADDSVEKYSIPGSDEKVVKDKISVFTGPNFYPIAREDWVQSSDALDIEQCAMVGFRFYLRPPQVELKARQGLFRQEAVDRLLAKKGLPGAGGSPDDFDQTKKERAVLEKQVLNVIDRNKPYEFYELWMKYDVDEDGEEDDIVVTIHRSTGIIMDAIYNPLFSNFRPFIKFIFYPVEYSRDGEGVCQILESIQSEINTLHNQRIDRITEINCPVFFVQAGSGLENLHRIEPGKIYPVEGDPSTAIQEMRYSDTVFSSFQEEDRLIAMADRAVGISPAVMGQSTAERPVAKETWALLEEANKKFKYGTENIRDRIREMGYKILEFMAQYSPRFTYYIKDEMGIMREETVTFPVESIREVFDITLASSSEVMSQEIRRETNLTLYQLLSDYMTKVGSMAQVLCSPQVPSEFKKVILDANDKSVKILQRIIDDFPMVPDSKSVVLDLRQAVDVNKVIMQSADLMPPQQLPPGGQGRGGQQGGQQGGAAPPPGQITGA